jgi:hypothetical protein
VLFAMNAAAQRIDKLVIIGVGLIGGSFALAQKAAGATGTIVGVGRGHLNLEEALEFGILDRFVPLTVTGQASLRDRRWCCWPPRRAVSGAVLGDGAAPRLRTRSSPTPAALSRT